MGSGITYSSRPVTKKFRTVFRPERRHSPHFRTTAYRVQRRTRNEAIPCQGESLSRKISGNFPFWTASLDIISEPPRTKYSEEPELYRFLARTKTCREIRIGPVRVSHILFRDKNLPERTVCVQSRGHFSTRNNPSIPACREIIAGLGD